MLIASQLWCLILGLAVTDCRVLGLSSANGTHSAVLLFLLGEILDSGAFYNPILNIQLNFWLFETSISELPHRTQQRLIKYVIRFFFFFLGLILL